MERYRSDSFTCARLRVLHSLARRDVFQVVAE